MSFAKLQLFFKSRNYREMFFLHVKLSIKNWIMKPFMYIKAIYRTIKLNRDYPSSWDKYVKLKEIERNIELKKKIKQKQPHIQSLLEQFPDLIYVFFHILLVAAKAMLQKMIMKFNLMQLKKMLKLV